MKGQKNLRDKDKWEVFEEIYIYTYKELCQHIQYLTTDVDKVKRLLVLTYMQFYPLMDQSKGFHDSLEWLKKKADYLAENEMKVPSEKIRATYAMEKEIRKEDGMGDELQKKAGLILDEASIFFDIKDQLNIEGNLGEKSESFLSLTIVRIFFSTALSIAAIGIVIFGWEKISQQLQILKEPFLKSLTLNKIEVPKNDDEYRIILNGKEVYLSEIGQVLYSLPLEEGEESFQNPEIQVYGDWTYYLPCPERKDTMLFNTSKNLNHTLYRIKNDHTKIELIAREVDDYCLWNNKICFARFGGFQTLDDNLAFETIYPGIQIYAEDRKLYLKDSLGRSMEKDENNHIFYEDRIYIMDGDCIVDLMPAEREKDGRNYLLKSIDEGRTGIFQKLNGMEEIFLEEKMSIDSFCIANNEIYYSVCTRKEGSRNFGRIYRKPLTGEEKPKRISVEFPGRITQMYYCEENKSIYADYLLEKGENRQGVIAVISLDGQMSYLDDKELRSSKETSGNDFLKFVMVQDNQVYCYWQDFGSNEGSTEVLWTDALVIPNSKRIYMN